MTVPEFPVGETPRPPKHPGVVSPERHQGRAREDMWPGCCLGGDVGAPQHPTLFPLSGKGRGWAWQASWVPPGPPGWGAWSRQLSTSLCQDCSAGLASSVDGACPPPGVSPLQSPGIGAWVVRLSFFRWRVSCLPCSRQRPPEAWVTGVRHPPRSPLEALLTSSPLGPGHQPSSAFLSLRWSATA